MRCARLAMELMAWLARGSYDGSCRHNKETRTSVSRYSACFLAHRYLHATTSICSWEDIPADSEAESGPPRHLIDTPASRELRLLVSDLRQREALRHRARRKGENQESDFTTGNFEGLLPVFKPSGITSADVCRVVRHVLRTVGACPPTSQASGSSGPRLNVGSPPLTAAYPSVLDHNRSYSQKRKLKVGHGGTLDPAASGVLVVGIGRGTLALQHLLNGPKDYVARVRLGTETDTLDAEGKKVRHAPWEHVSNSKLAEVVASFEGKYLQKPPLFSAKRVRGRQLYKLAREGSVIASQEHPAHCPVTIERIKLHVHKGVRLPDFDISIRCSKGTYIRQLAADIAAIAGTVAHLLLLVRTRQGPFAVEDCASLEGLSYERLVQHLVPLQSCQLRACQSSLESGL